MKKFTWILASILALSMAFIGCPTDGGGEEEGGGGGGGGYDGPVLKVKFAASGAGTTQVLKDGKTGDPLEEYDPGTLTYVAVGDGYRFQIGTDGNYGNGILRFKVDLGETALGDYKAVSFDFEAEGYSDDDDSITSNKKIFLLASKVEDNIKPYKSDVVPGEPGKSVVPLIISTDYFDDYPHPAWAEGMDESLKNPDKLYANALQPTLNGITKTRVTLPIVKSKSLMGETWFAIYLHARTGAYTISNFQFGADPNAPTAYGPNAPSKSEELPDPTAIPAGWARFELDLNAAVTATSTTSVDGGNATSTFAGGKLTSTFTANGMRLVFPLTQEQIDGIITADDKPNGVIVMIEGSIKTDDAENSGDAFRYSLAMKDSGQNWASTNLREGKFATILSKYLTIGNQNHTPDSFIIQHRNANSVTIEITKITIGYNGTPVASLVSIDVKTPPTDEIYQKDVTVFNPSGLVITTTDSNGTEKDVPYSHDAGFTFKLGSADLTPGTSTFSELGEQTITVTYKEKTATFKVLVSADAPPEVESIAIKEQPTKTTYKKGMDKFDIAGLEITATYDKEILGGGTTKDIEAEASEDITYKLGGTDLIPGTSTFPADGTQTITVTYEGKTATFDITVISISSFTIKTSPKTYYFVGDKFAPAGLVITATYSDSSTADIAYSAAPTSFTFADGATALEVGESAFDTAAASKTITVTYEGKTATFNIAVVVLGTETLAGVTIAGVDGVTDTTVKLPAGGGGLVAVTGGFTANITKGYGNSGVVFSVDLGAKTLGDFEKVTISFTGITGDYGQKNIFLLASNDEDDVTMYKSDPDIMTVIANSDNADTTKPLYDGAWGVVSTGALGAGTASKDLTIKAHTDLTGEVWFSIYLHGSPYSATITDITFVEKE